MWYFTSLVPGLSLAGEARMVSSFAIAAHLDVVVVPHPHVNDILLPWKYIIVHILYIASIYTERPLCTSLYVIWHIYICNCSGFWVWIYVMHQPVVSFVGRCWQNVILAMALLEHVAGKAPKGTCSWARLNSVILTTGNIGEHNAEMSVIKGVARIYWVRRQYLTACGKKFANSLFVT